MAGYQQHAEYKASRIDWLGVIPKHWEIKKLHHISRLRSGETMTAARMDESGEFPVYGGNGLRGYFDAYTHDGKYVLIGRQGALCGNINYACGKFWASEHAVVVSPTVALETFWLGELLRTMNLNQYSTSAAQPGISVEQIGRLKIPFPEQSEQKAIAAFLDYKTAQIDALIAKKEALLEKLAEKRTALISQAVTKGLDPSVPMKDSGIEWLGVIPTHWEISRPKYLCSKIVDGTHHTPEYIDEGVPFLTVKNLTVGEKISFQDTKKVSFNAHEELCKRAKPEFGDVLLTKDGTLGVTRVVETTQQFSIFVSLALLKPIHTLINSHYLRHVLESRPIITQLEARQLGSALKHIHLVELSNIFIPRPPVEEQEIIIHQLSQQNQKIDGQLKKIKCAIAALKEYRTALITNAVTGKIDVRDFKFPEATLAEVTG